VATTHNPEKGPRALSCEAWEAMLADALDGTLDARDAEAFTGHSKGCAAGCAELLEEAKRGTEWLRFLRETPEAPEGLLEKILVGTSGLNEMQKPLVAAGGAVAIPHQPWLGVSMALLQRHVAESRILMTLAMAFFSIALTLNLTGVRLNQLKLSDLSPSALAASVSHQYYTTSAHLTRYYLNLRIVYELESRVNEMRRDNSTPAAQPASQQPQQQPQQKPQPQKSSGKPGGSAHKAGSVAAPEQGQSGDEPPVRVLAKLEQDSRLQFGMQSEPSPLFFEVRVNHDNGSMMGPVFFSPSLSARPLPARPGNHHKPSERSLV
jgi:hypothetical protein